MTRVRDPVAIAVSLITSLVAACSNPIQTVGGSPQAVELRWYNDAADFSQAQAVAQAYWGERRPAVDDTFRDRDVFLATFQCRCALVDQPSAAL